MWAKSRVLNTKNVDISTGFSLGTEASDLQIAKNF